MNWFRIISFVMAMTTVSASRVKRGHPVGGPPPHGYAQAGTDAINEINRNERLAEWAASNAVGNAVANDYGNRLSTVAQYVSAFTVPVTKEQANNAFGTIAQQQKAVDVSHALALNSRAIHRAASGAAQSNYDQALQAQNLGYPLGNRMSPSHYY